MTNQTTKQAGRYDGKSIGTEPPTEDETLSSISVNRVVPELRASSVDVVLEDNSPEGELLPDETERWDYVSAGLEKIAPDHLFPHLVVGNTNIQPWEYLRREVPHTWYVDERYPRMGFLSRDEAAIVYNTAKMFSGKHALEVGCWRGWSTAHLLSGGVKLDIVDIILDDPIAAGELASIAEGLDAAETTTFNPGSSHIVVPKVAKEKNRRWSLMFIDGDHEAPAPANDAFLCSQYTEDDALMIFHDLASPAVADALGVMRSLGWKTQVYQTMQIIGVAWRGNVQPVAHVPDPEVEWHLPEHLGSYKLAHELDSEYTKRLLKHLPFMVDRNRAYDDLQAAFAQLQTDRDNWVKAHADLNEQWQKVYDDSNRNWQNVNDETNKNWKAVYDQTLLNVGKSKLSNLQKDTED